MMLNLHCALTTFIQPSIGPGNLHSPSLKSFFHAVPRSANKTSSCNNFARLNATRTTLTCLARSIRVSAPNVERDGHLYFATCARGLGEVLAAELRSTHIDAEVLHVAASGVQFRGRGKGHETAYKACLWLRTATRVLHHLFTTPLDAYRPSATADVVYDATKHSADWPYLLEGGQLSFSVQVRTSEPDGRDTPNIARLVQIRVKDAICDGLRDVGYGKPSPPPNHAAAAVPLFIAVAASSASLYRDMAGASLHKRGYRADNIVHRGALNEAVAAGVLYLAGFTPDGVYNASKGSVGEDSSASEDIFVVDPMCGSGTLLIEAALLRLQVAVGLYRISKFPFEVWPDFNEFAYAEIRDIAIAARHSDNDVCAQFYGSDVNASALAIANRSVKWTRLDEIIKLRRCDIRSLSLDKSPMLVVSNPPWGRRLVQDDAWYVLGRFLRDQAPNSTAVFLSGDPSATRSLRMKARGRYPVRTGNVDSRVLIYDVLPKRKVKQPEEHILST